ncbi:YggS family pyridoxal phosphate-dependent enzyme [Bacillus massiliglaciei]|uniref:YggS family pyridoxal phosphate-dependent enzyme n=1 Tax=Bacillus massiliglaciei TaxID=1816693 RepID=UPI000AFCB503|nr:YggS family pyridoxal phosphate-dependent enzyme [Bacillus massiliglaciei]
MKVADQLKIIERQIEEACLKTGRESNEITIIAVTKYVSAARAKEALEAGITNLGENRDEGLLDKYEVLKDEPNWHFIGTLQTRKVKKIIDKVSYIHSLDRISLAEEIHKRAKEPIKCLVQVNISGEDTKHGMPREDVMDFIRDISAYDRVIVSGLMTMAPLTDDKEQIRSCFRRLKELQAEVQEARFSNAPCTELSMGMSNDFPIAIEEGATMIRIGTALVGKEI